MSFNRVTNSPSILLAPQLIPSLNQLQISKPFSHSPLDRWLCGQCALPERLDVQPYSVNFDLAFIGIDYVYPIHQAPDIKEVGRGLTTSWRETAEYIMRANEIEEGASNSLLDHEERYEILEQLGSPPRSCYSIYFISVGGGENERLVYVGITGKDTHRFKKMFHSIAWNLHRPEYQSLDKKIYLGTVNLLDKQGEYLPLEWVSNLEQGLSLLESMESQLIHYFQPELNVQKKNSYCATYPFNCIQIENHTAPPHEGFFSTTKMVCWGLTPPDYARVPDHKILKINPAELVVASPLPIVRDSNLSFLSSSAFNQAEANRQVQPQEQVGFDSPQQSLHGYVNPNYPVQSNLNQMQPQQFRKSTSIAQNSSTLFGSNLSQQQAIAPLQQNKEQPNQNRTGMGFGNK